MILPYQKIFKQAYVFIKTNRFLIGFGLLLVLGGFFDYLYFVLQEDLVNTIAFSFGSIMQRNLILMTLIIGSIIYLLIYYRAQTAIILSTKGILDKQEVGFKKGFSYAGFFYLRVFGSVISIKILLFVLIAILAAPVIYLEALGYEDRAVTTILVSALIFVPIYLLSHFIINLAPIFVVNRDLTIQEAIKASFDLSLSSWKTMLVFSIVEVILLFLMFLVSIIIVGLFLLPVVLFSLIFYDMGAFINSSIVWLLLPLGLAVFFSLQAAIVTFHSVCWVLFFEQMVKPKKMTEENEVVSIVTEIAGS